MNPVFGTDVQLLPSHDGGSLLISDLHVPEDGGQAFERLRFALSAARRHGLRVFVLGDLFDSFVTPRQLGFGVWRDVCQELVAAAGAGVGVDLLVGNRDFLLGDEFVEATGAALHAGGVRLRLCGRETLLLHGDELCRNDLPYQRAKRWLRSRWLRVLARRLPLGLALRAAARARRRSAAVIASGDPERFAVPGWAIETAVEGGVERLVFGHIHRHQAAGIAGAEVRSLPAFDRDGIGCLVDGDGMRAVRCTGDGLEFEVAPPAPFVGVERSQAPT